MVLVLDPIHAASQIPSMAPYVEDLHNLWEAETRGADLGAPSRRVLPR